MTMEQAEQAELMTWDELAQMLRCSKRQAYRAAAKLKLRPMRITHKMSRFRRKDVAKALDLKAKKSCALSS